MASEELLAGLLGTGCCCRHQTLVIFHSIIRRGSSPRASRRTARTHVTVDRWSLALIPTGIVLVVVAATSLPARLATRIRIADALRYE